ncbi:hypothetical protein [Cellulomonas bogoriensis]|uniref:Uncharacterized protein n=1 Tax=Cellulomonas bogoriensis 69B4 = DSM 16987 TaxID=1386082 RepID=A0A0A0C2X3_9CELL|nr:hypothetical protein [Cellulomonas bogoriensis]KGM14531.1 hypothetical protein N869_05160 [Cellulomonas bogoriensis 69B4 = DSM 16987]
MTARDPEIASLLADIRSATADARRVTAETQRDRQAFAREQAETDRARERAARNGDLGPDWQVVQRRIDSGQTTLAAVLDGRDASPEAAALMDRAAHRLVETSVQLRTDPSRSHTEQLAELERTVEQMRATLERLTTRPRPDQTP